MNQEMRVTLQRGDITDVTADAIVNPADTDLLHGGGLAATIVEAACSIVTIESARIAPIPLGEAAITDAGKLHAKYIIHAASMAFGGRTTEAALRSALLNTYKRVSELGIQTLAMPSVGTGIGGFPVDTGAAIQMEMADRFLATHTDFKRIMFVLHTENDMRAYQAAFNNCFVHHDAQ